MRLTAWHVDYVVCILDDVVELHPGTVGATKSHSLCRLIDRGCRTLQCSRSRTLLGTHRRHPGPLHIAQCATAGEWILSHQDLAGSATRGRLYGFDNAANHLRVGGAETCVNLVRPDHHDLTRQIWQANLGDCFHRSRRYVRCGARERHQRVTTRSPTRHTGVRSTGVRHATATRCAATIRCATRCTRSTSARCARATAIRAASAGSARSASARCARSTGTRCTRSATTNGTADTCRCATLAYDTTAARCAARTCSTGPWRAGGRVVFAASDAGYDGTSDSETNEITTRNFFGFLVC